MLSAFRRKETLSVVTSLAMGKSKSDALTDFRVRVSCKNYKAKESSLGWILKEVPRM